MLTLDSPAKINLFLRILHKRSDNYHELASLFQAIALHDTIAFTFSSSDRLTTTDHALPTDHTNLILKAAHLFRKKTGLKFGLKAHLTKRIPHQAGLGGGSSNAATTLWALNLLTNTHAPSTELAAWGAEIGSDIPFFFSQGTAFCTGRGEIVANLPSPAPTPLWIIKPQESLSTPLVYQNFTLSQQTATTPESLLNSKTYMNDLEPAAFKALPALKLFKEKLLSFGFETVLMTGSGSAFFCLGTPSFPADFHPHFSCKTFFLNRSENDWYKAQKSNCT